MTHPQTTRRRFIKSTAAAALGTGVFGRAQAARYEMQPDHVTLTYDEQFLRRYRPRLVLRDLDIRPTALYGWKATSDEFEYTWAVFFAYYPYQDGIAPDGADSNLPDREPWYTAVDPDTGEVALTVYDQYHYLAGKNPVPNISDDGHPTSYVVPPWHPYTPTAERGQLVEVRDLHDRFEPWLANGWSVHPESVVAPPLRARGHWWDDDSLALATTLQFSEVWFDLNQQLPFDVPLPGRST